MGAFREVENDNKKDTHVQFINLDGSDGGQPFDGGDDNTQQYKILQNLGDQGNSLATSVSTKTIFFPLLFQIEASPFYSEQFIWCRLPLVLTQCPSYTIMARGNLTK